MTDDPGFRRIKPSAMDEDEFMLAFAEIYEDSSWVAEHAWKQGIDHRHDSVEAMHQALVSVFLNAPRVAQLAVLRAHPQLAGRAAVEGTLSDASSIEQDSVGLQSLDSIAQRRFRELNQSYQRKFDFPFIMAIKGRSRDEILSAFEQRLQNEKEDEFVTALRQVNEIALIRLQTL